LNLLATDDADAIAQFNAACGIISTVHQYDVEWLADEHQEETLGQSPVGQEEEPAALPDETAEHDQLSRPDQGWIPDPVEVTEPPVVSEVVAFDGLPNGLTELPDGDGPGESADAQEPDHHEDDGADAEPESGPLGSGPIGEHGDVPGATEPTAGPGEQADPDSGGAGGE
jgi:hypothetical protein